MRDIYLTLKGHSWWLPVLPATGFALAAVLAAWQAEMHRGALLLGAGATLLACWLLQRRPRWVR